MKRTKWIELDDEPTTLGDLMRFANENLVPVDELRIEYAGCGSHCILLEWDDGKPEPVPPLVPCRTIDRPHEAHSYYGETAEDKRMCPGIEEPFGGFE